MLVTPVFLAQNLPQDIDYRLADIVFIISRLCPRRKAVIRADCNGRHVGAAKIQHAAVRHAPDIVRRKILPVIKAIAHTVPDGTFLRHNLILIPCLVQD